MAVQTREKWQYRAESFYKVESCRSETCQLSTPKTVMDDDCLHCNLYVRKHNHFAASPPEILAGEVQTWLTNQMNINSGKVQL